MEGRSLSEVAHLAQLGVNTVRAGILGLHRIKAARDRCFFFQKLHGRNGLPRSPPSCILKLETAYEKGGLRNLPFSREDEKESGIWIKEVSEITCIGE